MLRSVEDLANSGTGPFPLLVFIDLLDCSQHLGYNCYLAPCIGPSQMSALMIYYDVSRKESAFYQTGVILVDSGSERSAFYASMYDMYVYTSRGLRRSSSKARKYRGAGQEHQNPRGVDPQQERNQNLQERVMR